MALSAKLYFDGSCGPKNPGGTAAGGFVLLLDDFERISGAAVIAQNSTNNVAEWGALLLGLKAAIGVGVQRLQIFGDSNIVVNQLNMRWRCKRSHLREMRDEAHRLLESFGFWEATWIPREQNSEADALSTSVQASSTDWQARRDRKRKRRHRKKF